MCVKGGQRFGCLVLFWREPINNLDTFKINIDDI